MFVFLLYLTYIDFVVIYLIYRIYLMYFNYLIYLIYPIHPMFSSTQTSAPTFVLDMFQSRTHDSVMPSCMFQSQTHDSVMPSFCPALSSYHSPFFPYLSVFHYSKFFTFLPLFYLFPFASFFQHLTNTRLHRCPPYTLHLSHLRSVRQNHCKIHVFFARLGVDLPHLPSSPLAALWA